VIFTDVIDRTASEAMLAQSARERALRGADFKTPFEEQASSLPLGPEPMLATDALAPMAVRTK
jgi:hypothetical protein